MRRLFLLLILLPVAAGCGPTADDIRAEIAAANYCEADTECRVANAACPFGCYALVHESEVDRIESLVADYDSSCDYSCTAPPEQLVCDQGTCIESPKSEEELIAERIDQAAYCETADDCENVGAVCEFGCAIYVNQAEAEAIRDLLDDFESQCDADCPAATGVECNDSICEAVFE